MKIGLRNNLRASSLVDHEEDLQRSLVSHTLAAFNLRSLVEA